MPLDEFRKLLELEPHMAGQSPTMRKEAQLPGYLIAKWTRITGSMLLKVYSSVSLQLPCSERSWGHDTQ